MYFNNANNASKRNSAFSLLSLFYNFRTKLSYIVSILCVHFLSKLSYIVLNWQADRETDRKKNRDQAERQTKWQGKK